MGNRESVRETRDRTVAFKMSILRRTEKIEWTGNVSNEEVLNRIKKNRALLYIILKRKQIWIDTLLEEKAYYRLNVVKGTAEG